MKFRIKPIYVVAAGGLATAVALFFFYKNGLLPTPKAPIVTAAEDPKTELVPEPSKRQMEKVQPDPLKVPAIAQAEQSVEPLPLIRKQNPKQELNTDSSQPSELTISAIKIALAGGANMNAPPVLPKTSLPKENISKQQAERNELIVERLEAANKDLLERNRVQAESIKALQQEIASLNKKVVDLERDASLLRNIANNPATQSKSSPIVDQARSGSLKLSNDYNQEMSIVVNGMSYRLQPGQERIVRVPAGPYTFQVLQLQRELQERTIAAGEEKPIRVRP